MTWISPKDAAQLLHYDVISAPEKAAPRVIEPIRNAKMEENARRASIGQVHV